VSGSPRRSFRLSYRPRVSRATLWGSCSAAGRSRVGPGRPPAWSMYRCPGDGDCAQCGSRHELAEPYVRMGSTAMKKLIELIASHQLGVGFAPNVRG
jgi:hypothetical protein